MKLLLIWVLVLALHLQPERARKGRTVPCSGISKSNSWEGKLCGMEAKKGHSHCAF